MSKEDLLPDFSHLTHEERVANGRKGGINSGIAKREKKKMKQLIEMLMAMPMKKGKAVDISKIKSIDDLKGKNLDMQTAIIIAQAKKAVNGDILAATFLRDTMGENPLQAAREVEINDEQYQITDASQIIFAVKTRADNQETQEESDANVESTDTTAESN